MGNPLNLQPGTRYKISTPFKDYDGNVHDIGQEWTFVETNFLPYEDGLTVHVKLDDHPTIVLFRLQWRKEEQADIIENFLDYVTACK